MLKPYSPQQVIKALNRISNNLLETEYYNQLKQLFKENNSKASDRISITTAEGVSIFKVSEIVRLEADRSYCYIYQKSGKRLLVSRPVKDIESLLPSEIFFRIHSAHLVNINYVKQIISRDGGEVELHDGKLLPLARRRRVDFLKILAQ